MRVALFALLLLAACTSERRVGTTGVIPRDAGPVALTTDASTSDATTTDASTSPQDAATNDAGTNNSIDAGHFDAGGTAYDAGATSPPDAGPPPAEVSLTFTGCSPDFTEDLVVSYNGSIAIGSVQGLGGPLLASLQFDLDGPGTRTLSTRHRIESGEVVNLVIGTTWTNMSTDSEVIVGNAPDPVGGQLIVRTYAPSAGRIDVSFVGVTLLHVQDGSICRIDGDVRATRLGR